MKAFESGNCEPLKASVHGLLLVTMALEPGRRAVRGQSGGSCISGSNAIVYGCAVYWERCHVVHHLNACPVEPPVKPDEDETPAAA